MYTSKILAWRSLSLITIFLFVSLSCGTLEYTPSEDDDVSMQLFYDQLSPYGSWIDYPEYGYVWVPDVDASFTPYSTDGYWVMTNYGWTWVSNYSWGWAPFHYGRWDHDSRYGWFWIPDREWGPAWVDWRYTDGYYGWAPLGPRNRVHPDNSWVFINQRDFGKQDQDHYYVRRDENSSLMRNSRQINNTYLDQKRNTTYITGPKKEEVQRATGRKIEPFTIQDDSRPQTRIKNKQLQIYRPPVEIRNNKAGRSPAPYNIRDGKDIKPPEERTIRREPMNNNKPENTPPQQRKGRRR